VSRKLSVGSITEVNVRIKASESRVARDKIELGKRVLCHRDCVEGGTQYFTTDGAIFPAFAMASLSVFEGRGSLAAGNLLCTELLARRAAANPPAAVVVVD